MTPTVTDLLAPVAAELEVIERRLVTELDSDSARMAATLRPIVLGGGKRLRPALVLLAGRLGSASAEALADIATGIEFIHTATLVHDDVIDESPTRRGVTAVHVREGRAAAIVSGDHYLAKGIGLCAKGGGAAVAKRVAQTVMTICSGELDAMSRSGDLGLSLAEYETAIERKTAVLTELCCYAAGVVAGLDARHLDALAGFGHDLGMAFQVADDLFDYIADSGDVGKPVGADLAQGTVTLPLILALEDAAVGSRIRDELEGGGDVAEVVTLVRASNGVARARARADEFAESARRHLAVFGDGPDVANLAAIASYVVRRSS